MSLEVERCLAQEIVTVCTCQLVAGGGGGRAIEKEPEQGAASIEALCWLAFASTTEYCAVFLASSRARSFIACNANRGVGGGEARWTLSQPVRPLHTAAI